MKTLGLRYLKQSIVPLNLSPGVYILCFSAFCFIIRQLIQISYKINSYIQ